MDHVALISSLPTDEKARLLERSDAAGLRQLALHVGALALTGAGIATGMPGWPVLVALHGVLLCFLFTLAHECTHQTPFRTRWINEAAGLISSG